MICELPKFRVCQWVTCKKGGVDLNWEFRFGHTSGDLIPGETDEYWQNPVRSTHGRPVLRTLFEQYCTSDQRINSYRSLFHITQERSLGVSVGNLLITPGVSIFNLRPACFCNLCGWQLDNPQLYSQIPAVLQRYSDHQRGWQCVFADRLQKPLV